MLKLKNKRIASLIYALLLLPGAVHASEYVDFPDNPAILSFEKGISPAVAGRKSELGISDRHSKLGEHSLMWKWKKAGASFEIPVPVPYLEKNPNPKETSISSFVFWVYAPAPLDGDLTFSFMKGDRVCCSFSYTLGFTGWRGAWVAFGRDMQGSPEEGMDRIVVTAPQSQKKGVLFFDGIIPSVFEDARYHTADWQAPFINPETDSHWLILNRSWQKILDITPPDELSAQAETGMDTVRARFITLVTEGKKPEDAITLAERFSSYDIRTNSDGTIKGKPVFFTRYGETFINEGISDASAQFSANGQLLKQANDFMLDLAVAYLAEKDETSRGEIAGMYVAMTRHMLDQGFAAGSALGTLHHLGYSMRNFYTAPVIMRDVLREAGLTAQVQQAMEWFAGTGEVKTAPEDPGIDIDAFNTSLMGRVASVLMLEDTPYKEAYLKALARWIDNGFRYTEGLRPAFKRDGTVQHHRKAYPAYATGGFQGAVNAVWMLHGTEFAISEESHRILKDALLEMRFYCNLRSFPLAMSGRHPDGMGALIPSQYARLADAGSPDGGSDIDKDLASAYLRLTSGDGGYWGRKFAAAGITAEKSPTGCHTYPFNCSLSYRQDDWLVTIAGHSRYLWSAEIYNGANHYGRYLTHGSMEITADGQPISIIGSGFSREGWDWCHIPGTTAAQIPMEAMKADVRNVDEFSGYEEMLLSDEWFAGGVSHRGRSGAFAMILHEHDKYNGSLRARKSFFTIGNRVIALGSDLQNLLPGSSLHTTLFQNTLPADEAQETAHDTSSVPPTRINGQAVHALGFDRIYSGNMTVLNDRFGNAWFVKDATVEVSRGMQHSYHEETDEPVQGYFEKAWICHGDIVGKGVIADDINMKDSYEFMAVIHASPQQMQQYAKESPYIVLRCDRKAHIIYDRETGTAAGAIYEDLREDDTREQGHPGGIPTLIEASPCIIMYSMDNGRLILSASNPDLALYEGESDETYDQDGKRTERSVYGREWIDSPCSPVPVRLVIEGEWNLAGTPDMKVDVRHAEGDTILEFTTFEGMTEELELILGYDRNRL